MNELKLDGSECLIYNYSLRILIRILRFFYRAVNSNFDRIASEESVLQLIKGKCLSIFYYTVLKYAPLKADLRSYEFVIMKLFRTNNMILSHNVSIFETLTCLYLLYLLTYWCQ